MGGQNHQPCRIYLPNSTMLSRCISLARAELDLANIELEDVLLLELNGGIGDVQKIILHLNSSANALNEAKTTLDKLRVQMDKEGFQDLPPIKKLNLDVIGEDMSIAGMVDIASWNTITEIMRKGGFYLVLRHFEFRINALINKTHNLTSIIAALIDAVFKGELNLVLEENRTGSFKTEFAQLYTDWANFNNEFLASSMCSTELWYSFNNLGSLAPQGAVRQIA